MATPTPARSGFSFTELMATLALAALVIGVFVPVLRRSADRQHAVQCVDRLRAASADAMGYAHDHDGDFPLYFIAADQTPEGLVVAPRERSRDDAGITHLPAGSLRCPADFDPATATVAEPSEPQRVKVSFARNLAAPGIGLMPQPAQLATAVVLLYDADVPGEPEPGVGRRLYAGVEDFVRQTMQRRHPGETLNAAFTDGRVERLKELATAWVLGEESQGEAGGPVGPSMALAE